MKSKFLFALVLLGGVFLSLISDEQSLGTLIKNLERYTLENPQEKIHLHFDKPYYTIGDDLWFKAYVVNAEENKLSTFSNVLYVDFIDERDSVNKTLVLPVENGLSNANINLSDSLFTQGTYRIRAYTNWMKNFSGDFFYNKAIFVGGMPNGEIKSEGQIDVIPKNEQMVLNAVIRYKDFKNNPQINKEVTFKLKYKNETLFSGKEITDKEGVLKISNLLKKGIEPTLLVLNTFIKGSDGKIITRDFRVNNLLLDLNVQFFPEGGDLVNGIRSKVAFKALGSDGMGKDVSGYIEDQDKKKITEFKVDHFGMGLFVLTPESGKNYTAIIDVEPGLKKRYALPKAKEEGYVITLNHVDNDNILMRVECSPSLINKDLSLVIQSNGNVKTVSKLTMNKAFIVSRIEKNALSDGINHFTLFISEAIPVAERLIFIYERNPINAVITTNKQIYTKREKVDLTIQVKDNDNNGLIGGFSMSVINKDNITAKEEDETTVFSNLLLTSDLKGYIEKPNYYFTNVNAEKNKSLDILLLTQGWRRFKWNDIKEYKAQQSKFIREKGLSIDGTITNLSNKPIPYGKVNLFIPSLMTLIDTVADINGHFIFDELNFSDTTKVIIRAKSAKDRNNVKIKLNENRIPKIEPFRNTFWANDQSFVNSFYNTEKMIITPYKNGWVNNGIMLKEVEIKQKKMITIPRSAIPDQVFPDYTLTPEALQTSGNVTNILSRLPGIKIMYSPTEGYIVVGTYRGEEGRMLLLLNGQRIENLNGIDPRSLAGIQVIRGGSNSIGAGTTFDGTGYGGSSKYGIVFLTMETKATKYNSYAPTGLSVIKPMGYELAREFYSPAYNLPDDRHKLPDLRSTIYWNPNLISNENGVLNMGFYTSDETGNYQVTLEGVTLSGKLARKIYTFKVD